MFDHLVNAIQPAGLVLVGTGLVSLIFSERLAALDSILDSAMIAKVEPEHSRRWVEVAGTVWGVLGLALLFIATHLS